MKKPRHVLKAFTVAMMFSLTLVAVTASSAAALSFEAPPFPIKSTASGEGLYLKVGLRYVECTSKTSGSASLQGKSSGTASLEFHGCSLYGWGKCTSSGGAETIVTKPLAMDLVKLPKGKEAELYPPGIMLTPFNFAGVFAEFTCGGISFKLTGGLLGKLEKPGYAEESSELKINFFEPGHGQTYNGREVNLTASVNGGSFAEEITIERGGVVSLSNSEEQKITLSTDQGIGHPAIALAKGFPAAVSVPLEGLNVTLRSSARNIKCTSIAGSGEFSSPSAGKVTLTLHNCKESALSTNCTSAGQSPGTVVTESLPVQLTYLANGEPGIAFEANESSGKVAEMSCVGGLVKVKVTGGVLGSIHGGYQHLNVGVHAVEKSGGYVQEYTNTAEESSFSLSEYSNGGAAKAASLDIEGGLDLAFSEDILLEE